MSTVQNANLVIAASHNTESLSTLTSTAVVLDTIRLLAEIYPNAVRVIQMIEKGEIELSVINTPILLRLCAPYEHLCTMFIHNRKITHLDQDFHVNWWSSLMILVEVCIDLHRTIVQLPSYTASFRDEEAHTIRVLLRETIQNGRTIVDLYDTLFDSSPANKTYRENPRIACFFWDCFWPDYATDELCKRALDKHATLRRVVREWGTDAQKSRVNML